MTVLEVITQLIKEKEERKVVPLFALYVDVITRCEASGYTEDEIKSELKRLREEGLIKRGHTINGIWITVQ